MKGYFRDAAETDKAIVDGWFHTGDAAVVHSDGYVEIRDRFKDVIISGGENISSVEVESVLLRHDAVQELSVVGMPHPKWGEAAHAFVVLRPGKTATEAEIVQFARDANLAHFKAPELGFVACERSAEDRDGQNTKILAAWPRDGDFQTVNFCRPLTWRRCCHESRLVRPTLTSRVAIFASAAAIGARRLILESPLTGHSVRANSAQAKSTRTYQSDAFRNDRKECGQMKYRKLGNTGLIA